MLKNARAIPISLLIALAQPRVPPIRAVPLLPNGVLATEHNLGLSNQETIKLRTFSVDGYSVTIENPELEVFLIPCLFSPYGGPGVSEKPRCEELTTLPSTIILPISNEKRPSELYQERQQHPPNNYPPQELALVTGFLGKFNSTTVESIERIGNTWSITINLNDTSRTAPSSFWGVVVRVDLGYLEPNPYRVVIHWNSNPDEEIIDSRLRTFDFTVSAPSSN